VLAVHTAAEPAPLPPAAPPSVDPLARRHVLVVGMHYPPQETAVAGWTAGIAAALAHRAATVTVLSGLPHSSQGVDGRYRGLRRLVLPAANGAGPTVVRIGHHIPERWTAPSDARYQLSFARRAVTARLPQRPDLVIGVTPSPGAAAAAARIARRYGAPLVVAVHALADQGAGASTGATAARLERYALDRAERVVVTNRALAPALAALGIPYERISTHMP